MTAALDFDIADIKASRATRRSHSLFRDRADYQQRLAKRMESQSDAGRHGPLQKGPVHCRPVSYFLARPHRAARAVTRSLLANDAVEGEKDMPTVSIGHIDFHKPSVSRSRVHSGASCDVELDGDYENSDIETSLPDDAEIAEVSSVSTASSPAFSCSDLSPMDSNLEKYPIMLEEPVHEDTPEPTKKPQHYPKISDAGKMLMLKLVRDAGASKTIEVENDQADNDSTKLSIAPARRESILRELVTNLLQQSREAEREAEASKARAREIEQKVVSQQRQEQVCSRKQALQEYKQQAAQMRKQRNQAAQLQAVKEKANCKLQEAASIREQAQVEATVMRAQLLADASRDARTQAETHIQTEINAAQAEAQLAGMDAMAQAKKIKDDAEKTAQSLREEAEKELHAAASAKSKAMATQAEAEATAQMIREAASQHAVALKARVFAQLHERVEAENKACSEAAHMAQYVAEAQHLAEETEKGNATATLKSAKLMEERHARQIHKQAQQERREAQIRLDQLEAVKAQAEEEKQRIKQQALSEVAAMKAKVKAHTRVSRSRARSNTAARAEKDLISEAAALRSEAEMEAAAIKAQAAEEAEELLKQAEAERAQAQKALTAVNDAMKEDLVASTDLVVPELEQDWHVLPAGVASQDTEEVEWGILV